jgi:predicted DNA binding CopG/RHH family protein
MKKISKKRELALEASLAADGDEEQWDTRQLGNDPQHTKPAPEEYTKTASSVGTSIRMPLKLIKELKKIAEEEGMPYQTLVKSILTKFIRNRNRAI